MTLVQFCGHTAARQAAARGGREFHAPECAALLQPPVDLAWHSIDILICAGCALAPARGKGRLDVRSRLLAVGCCARVCVPCKLVCRPWTVWDVQHTMMVSGNPEPGRAAGQHCAQAAPALSPQSALDLSLFELAQPFIIPRVI